MAFDHINSNNGFFIPFLRVEEEQSLSILHFARVRSSGITANSNYDLFKALYCINGNIKCFFTISQS